MLGQLEIFCEVCMDNGLERYLQSLAHELRCLPQERREEELREIRLHLDAIVARLMEGGLSEAEAVEATISQFGAAHTVGHELARVAPRSESRLRTLAAGGRAVTCYLSLNLLLLIYRDLFAFLLFPFPELDRALSGYLFSLTRFMYSGNALVFLLVPLIAGMVFHCIAPKSRNPKSRSGTSFWLFGGATCLLMVAIALTQ